MILYASYGKLIIGLNMRQIKPFEYFASEATYLSMGHLNVLHGLQRYFSEVVAPGLGEFMLCNAFLS